MAPSLATEISIKAETDIVVARRTVRDAAIQLGFGPTDVTRIVTAASELARNVFKYAGEGVMRWRSLQGVQTVGIELEFQDSGPGIPDVHWPWGKATLPAAGWAWGFPAPKGWPMKWTYSRGQTKAPGSF